MKPSTAAEVRMGELSADFGKTAADYGKYRAGFPPELFDRLAAMGIVRAGMRTVDLGLERGRSRAVSPSAAVNRPVWIGRRR